ncbi:glycosyltransferase family 1 protein [bacterium]|nr:MAG: glycosyltransferase family 1 protein [bacterium]
MGNKVRFVFWQNGLTFHQMPHIRALARRGHETIWVATEDMPEGRREQGWPEVDPSPAQSLVTTDPVKALELLAKEPENSVHVFSGIRGCGQYITDTFMASLQFQTRRIILIEQRDDRGVVGALRRLNFLSDYWRYGKYIEAVLCMGYTGEHGGRHWYRRSGYPNHKVWPYGYWLEADPNKTSSHPTFHDSPEVKLMCLGSLIKRKGQDILLRALGALKKRRPDLKWSLHLMGWGEMQAELEALVKQENLAQEVTFTLFQPNDVAMAAIAQSDLVVVPSRFDGWGVVTNEALLRGVPVICSDYCGSKDLVGQKWRGEVFRTGDEAGLSRVLEKWIERGPKTPESAARIRKWTPRISGEVAADYFVSLLDASPTRKSPPLPLWLLD